MAKINMGSRERKLSEESSTSSSQPPFFSAYSNACRILWKFPFTPKPSFSSKTMSLSWSPLQPEETLPEAWSGVGATIVGGDVAGDDAGLWS